MTRVLDFVDSFSSASAPSVSGGSAIYEVIATQTISNGGTVDHNDSGAQLRRIKGDTTGVTLAAAPFGTTTTNFSDGMTIILQGDDSTNTITIGHQDTASGVILNGDIELKKGSMLELIYDSGEDRWIENSRKELP